MYVILCKKQKNKIISYLRRRQYEGQYPRQTHELRTSLGSDHPFHGVPYSEISVHPDQHQHERTQVQTEHFYELEQFTGDVSKDPCHGITPQRFAPYAEHRDEQISDRQVRDQRVNRRPGLLLLSVYRDRVDGRYIGHETEDRDHCQHDHFEHGDSRELWGVFQACCVVQNAGGK